VAQPPERFPDRWQPGWYAYDARSDRAVYLGRGHPRPARVGWWITTAIVAACAGALVLATSQPHGSGWSPPVVAATTSAGWATIAAWWWYGTTYPAHRLPSRAVLTAGATLHLAVLAWAWWQRATGRLPTTEFIGAAAPAVVVAVTTCSVLAWSPRAR
jgi:hypothetical protein